MKVFLASILLFVSVHAAPTEDYRNLYDNLLVETINEKLRSAEQAFERINQQVNEFLSTKKEDLRQQIIREIELIAPGLKDAEQKVDTELKKTDLNTIEKFIFNKAKDEIELLILTLTGLENTVKGHTPEEQKIIEDLEQQVKTAEQKAQAILKEIHDYNLNKTATVKNKIIAEIDAYLPTLKKLSQVLEDELVKRIGHGRPERLRVEKLLTTVRRVETTLTEEQAKLKA